MTGGQEIQREDKRANQSRGQHHAIAGLGDGKGPQTQERRPPLEVGRGGDTDRALLPPEGLWPSPWF